MRHASFQWRGRRLLAGLASGAFVAVASALPVPAGVGQGHGWLENAGWLNLLGNNPNGVRVHDTHLSGYAWGENIGWVHFGDGSPANGISYSNTTPGDCGVNRDPAGNLSGFAWGENVGWISMDTTASGGSRVSISQTTGRFEGYAWCENIGWLAFETVPSPPRDYWAVH